MQNGKHFKMNIIAGSKVSQNEFTLGEECEMETLNGEKIKVRGAPLATLCFYTLLSPGLPPSRLSLHNSHHGHPISELIPGVRGRETGTTLKEEALNESTPIFQGLSGML